MHFGSVFLCLLIVNDIAGQRHSDRLIQFVNIFSGCHRNDSSRFDTCIKRALNDVRPFFATGVPELNVAPFDPFFAEEVVQHRGNSAFNYRLTLRNVYERGWTNSEIYRFRSDMKSGAIRYHQWFPEKYLKGDWEIMSNFLSPYANSGTFDLSLYNYTQVTTIRRNSSSNTSANPLTVRIEALDCGDLKLHISNLLKGRAGMELLLDRLINASWRFGFQLLKPLIDDLVSTAFTQIFNDNFKNFPFDAVIPR